MLRLVMIIVRTTLLTAVACVVISVFSAFEALYAIRDRGTVLLSLTQRSPSNSDFTFQCKKRMLKKIFTYLHDKDLVVQLKKENVFYTSAKDEADIILWVCRRSVSVQPRA